jgi:type IV secretory pathway TraG/TraD family ATPase VirD4
MKPPLTREQIQAIQSRNLYSTDVRTLLWEIKRLRALTLRTHDYFRQDATSSTAKMLAEHLQALLGEEPVVKEQPKL